MTDLSIRDLVSDFPFFMQIVSVTRFLYVSQYTVSCNIKIMQSIMSQETVFSGLLADMTSEAALTIENK